MDRNWVRVGTLAELQSKCCVIVNARGNDVAVFYHEGQVYAVDNRCPHMGFPLQRGSVKDGILTCHWHHARFDLATGGTFDQFADDVRAFRTQQRGDEVWVDVSPRADARAHQRQRLHDGLERNIPLVIAKAVIALLDEDNIESASEPFRIGLAFGTRYRQAGWGQGLTILTCMMNLLPHLAAEDRPRALYHGLSAVARDCDGAPPRFAIHPLPGEPKDVPTLKRWLRSFIEVRDSEGAERCIVSALRAGATPAQIADLLFSAVTDHRYIQIGHPLDFTNKALQALDRMNWDMEMAETVLPSLASGYANADRMEESNAWRNPIDLITILDDAFAQLHVALQEGAKANRTWQAREGLVTLLLAEDPQATVDAMLDALRSGARMDKLAGTVAYAAALRIARFHTSNEFGDWDTALHTFTFANAVHQGLRRVASPELLRGAFDAAMSIYLDRFLNVPPARLPAPNGHADADSASVLAEFPALLNRQQQVDEAGERAAHYLFAQGEAAPFLALLGKLLLREDRDFHTIQSLEAACAQYALLRDDSQSASQSAVHVLVAAARYLAAHAPTMRAQGQTYQIAARLSRGERLFEG
jgi:nitrite reductase/ring-hydroxylating ferredoxin subunit